MKVVKVINLEDVDRVLTFFAHPDDEVLGAGGTLSRLSRMGVDVHVAIPATGIHSRRNVLSKEQRDRDLIDLRGNCQQALRKLGISPDNIYLGEFPDNEMDANTLLTLVRYAEEIIEAVRPSLIFTHHWRCTNIDHQYCHEAIVVASRPSISQHIPIICAEIPSSTGYLKPTFWEPNLFVEITEDDLQRKTEAMETYKGESRPDPHPRSREVLMALAKLRGSEAGFFFAEAFMIQKCFAQSV